MKASLPWPTRWTPSEDVIEWMKRPAGEPLRLMAEIKFRSPSAGKLSTKLSASERSIVYANAGVRMISVLTDGSFFDGSFDHLSAVRASLESAFGAKRPRLLCKEFVLDPVQLDRARSAGADTVLLIARLVEAERLGELAQEARARGLEPLVEIANETELEGALAAKAGFIGVNARDLDTLGIDAERAMVLVQRIPKTGVRAFLSGLRSPEDVAAMTWLEIDAALVGEALMRQDDPADKVGQMVEACRV